MDRALTAQRSGRLESAEEFYREALNMQPKHPDALHMLGVVLYSQCRYRESAPLIRSAGELTSWKLPGVLHNYGLVLGVRLSGRDVERRARVRLEYRLWSAECAVMRTMQEPLVSVVVPSYNHAAYIEEALHSVFAQTYRDLELIVIDDGSLDASPDIIRKKLLDCPFPHRFIARDNRGAHSTLNEAIMLAKGMYINPLNSDDRFEPSRMEEMVAAISRAGYEWGFSRCACIDSIGARIASGSDPLIKDITGIEEMILSADTVGTAFVGHNVATSTSNLFFSRDLFIRLAGFNAFYSNHDWDFCLRALWLAEPCFVPADLLQYRLHGTNTIRESTQRNKSEADQLIADFHRRALSEEPGNPFAPSRRTTGIGYIATGLRKGHGVALEPSTLKSLDDELNLLDEQNRTRSEQTSPNGLSIVGYFSGEFGLAESVRALASTCLRRGIAASFRDAELELGSRQANRVMDNMLSERMPYKPVLFYLNPDALASVLLRLKERGELENRYVIGYWYWEIDAFPRKWEKALGMVDEIWVATDFVLNIVKRATTRPVIKIPHAVDITLPRDYRRSEFSLPEDRFIFLFTFDFGSYAERKNPQAVVEAFTRAFGSQDSRVGLVVKCSQGHKFPEKLDGLLGLARDDPRIVILDKLLSREDVYGLQSVCDAYVSLHRAEGLGLGMAECMAQGKPVIGTAYSGNMEFMNVDNSCLVDYRLIPLRPGQFIDYEPGWQWADADIDQAAGYMRRLVEDPKYRNRIADRAASDMAGQYNHAAVGRAIKHRLAELERLQFVHVPGQELTTENSN
ncbi:MAG: glycosyltransferase [Casimicrobiaceae bacterium]